MNPQQMEFRRNAKGATSQDSRKTATHAGGHPLNKGTSNADVGRTVPRGQVSPYGPAGEPIADDESDERG